MLRNSFLAGIVLAGLSAGPALAVCNIGDATMVVGSVNQLRMIVPAGTGCPLRLVRSGGPMLGVAVTKRPAHGTVSVQGQTVIYFARAGYAGPDSFAYVRKGLDPFNKPLVVEARVAVQVVR